MNIKVFVFTSSNRKTDITEIVEDVTWSGDVKSISRTLEVTMKNINNKRPVFNYNVGNAVIATKDNKEFFRGYIFKRGIDILGKDDFTAYDVLAFAGKNDETLLVKNQSASSVIRNTCNKFGIPIGNIENTGYNINKLLFQKKSLNDIWKDVLEETTKNNKKNYYIYSEKGKIYVRSREHSQKLVITIQDILGLSRDISIESLRTQVKVTKGSLDPKDSDKKYKEVIVKDGSAINNYGLMQHVEEVDDDMNETQMRRKANSILSDMKKPEETIKAEFYGEIQCTTGNQMQLNDGVTNLVGKFYITSDKHTFQEGRHMMSLELSKKLE